MSIFSVLFFILITDDCNLDEHHSFPPVINAIASKLWLKWNNWNLFHSTLWKPGYNVYRHYFGATFEIFWCHICFSLHAGLICHYFLFMQEKLSYIRHNRRAIDLKMKALLSIYTIQIQTIHVLLSTLHDLITKILDYYFFDRLPFYFVVPTSAEKNPPEN